LIKDVLRNYLLEKGFRNTPERYTILEEIYNMDHHFNVDDLYLLMMQKNIMFPKQRFTTLLKFSLMQD
jgi:Fur family ferric uptake transcriptional regulator